MIDKLTDIIPPSFVASAIAAFGYVFASADAGWLSSFDRGGFTLLTLVSLGVFFWLIGPKVFTWIKDYIERLEARNDSNQKAFLEELAKMRESRERADEAHREAMTALKDQTAASFSQHNQLINRLITKINTGTNTVNVEHADVNLKDDTIKFVTQ
jgi:predicted PurR-regulated permease PerM